MDNRERTRIRNLQDKVIAKMDRLGYTDDYVLWFTGPTLADIRECIYSGYDDLFNNFLEGL